MSDSILREKAKAFAKDIVCLCREIKAERRETVLVNQLLRSATSIGANYMRHSTLKVQTILYRNLKLHKKNAMKLNIG